MGKSQRCRFCRCPLPEGRDETCGSQCDVGLRTTAYRSSDYVKDASQKLSSFLGPIMPKNAVGYCLLTQDRLAQYPPVGRTKRFDGVSRITPFFYLSPLELPCVAYTGAYTILWYFSDGTILDSEITYYVEKEFTREFSTATRRTARHTAKNSPVRKMQKV